MEPERGTLRGSGWNLTYYNPGYVKKLKLFFWWGEWPEGYCASLCNEGTWMCKDESSYYSCIDTDAAADKECWNWSTAATPCSTTQECVEKGCRAEEEEPGVASLSVDLTTLSPYDWVNPDNGGHVQRINYTAIITETNNVQIVLERAWRCYLSTGCESPSDLSPSTNTIPALGSITKTSYVFSGSAGDKVIIYYNATDINNHKKTLNFSISFI
jgi:hypothetical protein